MNGETVDGSNPCKKYPEPPLNQRAVGSSPARVAKFFNDSSLAAAPKVQRNRLSATTLLQEQPKPRQPMTIMVFPNLRFSVGMGLAGLAQLR
jgi:hypothetical protein